MPINPALLDIAKLAAVLPSRNSVAPGDLVSATLALPLPPDSPALDGFAYSVFVRWFVTQTPPNLDANGLVTNVLAPETLGTDYIAPAGLEGITAVFGLLPPLATAAAPGPRPYWIAAEFTLDRKSTRLNSSHLVISYAVFCLKKKKLLQSLIDFHSMLASI